MQVIGLSSRAFSWSNWYPTRCSGRRSTREQQSESDDVPLRERGGIFTGWYEKLTRSNVFTHPYAVVAADNLCDPAAVAHAVTHFNYEELGSMKSN